MRNLLKIIFVAAAVSALLCSCAKLPLNPDGKTEASTSDVSETTSAQQETKSDASSEASTSANSSTSTSKTDSSELSSSAVSSEKSEPTASQAASSVQTTSKTTVRTTKKTSQQTVSNPTYINGVLIANKSYALPSNYNPGVSPAAQSAFNTMASAAAKDGINLYIVSGFRSYSTQASIYNNYVARDGKAAADRYSARPGHSEHQTGLAFDVNSLSQSFENTAEGRWLAANCHKYGFIIRYPKGKEGITGYMYEPWHIRYLGNPTAEAVYNSGLTLEEYLGINSVYQY